MHETPDDRMDELLKRLREEYNAPPPTPRDEMWAAIEAGLGARAEPTETLITPWTVRRSHALRWAAAAAAVLVLGVGIGRMTAPSPGSSPVGSPGLATVAVAPDPAILRTAAVNHLARSESLLTLVRADARTGHVEASVGTWAEALLTETRLLLDAQGDSDPVMRSLLEDLELVLAQVASVANAEGADEARVRSELTLALNGLEEREVLPRIQAVVPAGPGVAGT